MLQWARQHHCPWNDSTCHCAAAGGHLVLQWAREHGCEWNAVTCARQANGNGHLEVARWVGGYLNASALLKVAQWLSGPAQ